MIFVLTAQNKLASELMTMLTTHALAGRVHAPQHKTALEALYDSETTAAVVDAKVPFMPQDAWHDLLASLSRRMPVIVLGEEPNISSTSHHSESMSWLANPSVQEVFSILDACGALGVGYRKLQREVIPIFNPQVPLHMLQNHRALSLLYVDASSFRKIAIEYGSEAYARVQQCFYQILFELWGDSGSFRATDLLCRRSAHANAYYIFLEQARTSGTVPAPGVLERLAERLVVRLQQAFWKEMFVERSKRIMPDCIPVVPELGVGFATVLYNPCVDARELVEQVQHLASEEARLQLRRMRDRQRELMQSVIHTPGLLMPHYQAVFRLAPLTQEMVNEVRTQKSVQTLVPHLYGFESLIRVQSQAMGSIFDPNGPVYMDGRYMRPDVLFAMAHAAKVGLELDQACLRQAVLGSMALPGMLLINILPRNLYNIDRLQHHLVGRDHIMFEVSETEAINNFELMLKVRATLERMHMRIATDDFGRGYSGLEQIIKIKPDLIKLDRSLIQDIHKDKPKQSFVSGLVRAAQISNATILAEGVELWEEAQILQEMGIDLIQGFLLHKPQSAADIATQLEAFAASQVEEEEAPPTLGSVA